MFGDDPSDQLPKRAIASYRQLAAYVGKELTIHLHGRETIHVEVLSVIGTNGDVLVRRQLLGGAVEYILERASFEYALE